MAKGNNPKPRSPKQTPFKTNGFAPSYTPKPGESESKQHLKRLKDGVKKDK